MILSRFTTRARTTIPASVRRALGLKPGDHIAYELDGDRVIMTRAKPGGGEAFAVFCEWAGDADIRAYANL
jgi:antitoxin PrlF